MLKQLLKYEFKATGRTYGGLYLALVALAVLSGFSLRSSSKDNFASLLLFAYMVVAVAVASGVRDDHCHPLHPQSAGPRRLPDAHPAGDGKPAHPFQADLQRGFGCFAAASWVFSPLR